MMFLWILQVLLTATEEGAVHKGAVCLVENTLDRKSHKNRLCRVEAIPNGCKTRSTRGCCARRLVEWVLRSFGVASTPTNRRISTAFYSNALNTGRFLSTETRHRNTDSKIGPGG